MSPVACQYILTMKTFFYYNCSYCEFYCYYFCYRSQGNAADRALLFSSFERSWLNVSGYAQIRADAPYMLSVQGFRFRLHPYTAQCPFHSGMSLAEVMWGGLAS